MVQPAVPTPCDEAVLRDYHRRLCTLSRRRQEALKRILDLVLAALGLLLLSPCLGLLALLVRLDSPGPAFFSQTRLGRWGRLFAIYKLRTMVQDAPLVLNPDGSTRVVDGDPRVTRLGRLLRRWALDELPQLANVVRGDMSLVGPRPDHSFQLQYYEQGDCRKLAMRPGITSLAQVSGRNDLSWRHRTGLEIQYVESFSLGLDLQIAWRTVGVVLRGTGLNDPGPPPGETSPP
ncbi:MAG: sugar transferase [Anaerolineae bacterium]